MVVFETDNMMRIVYCPRSLRNRNLSQQQQDLKNIIYLIESNGPLQFEQSWIVKFLQTFGSIHEVAVFLTAFHKQTYSMNSQNNNYDHYDHSIIKTTTSKRRKNNQKEKQTKVQFPQSPASIQKMNFIGEEDQYKQDYYHQDSELQTNNYTASTTRSENQVKQEQSFDYEEEEDQQYQLDLSEVKSTAKRKAMQDSESQQEAHLPTIGYKQRKYMTPEVVARLRRFLQRQKEQGVPQINISFLAKKFGVHRTSINRLKEKWKNDPIIGKFLQTADSSRKRRPPTIVQCQNKQKWIVIAQKLVNQNPYLSLQRLRVQMLKIGGPKAPPPRLIKRMLNDCHYIYKKIVIPPKDTNSVVNIQKRHQYCSIFLKLREMKNLIFYLDQGKFDMNLSPDNIWVKTGQEPNPPIMQNQHISLFVAMTEAGQSYWRTKCQAQKNTFNQLQAVKGLLSEKVFPSNRQFKQKYLIMNGEMNIEQHQFRNFLLKNQWKLIIIPPQSQFLNPIWLFYLDLKQIVRKQAHINSIEQLQSSLNNSSLTLCQQSMQNYFMHIIQYASRGLKKQPF